MFSFDSAALPRPAELFKQGHPVPFPATGHPGFTAVGIPASLQRFAMLQCYDGVRLHRLPSALADHIPSGKLWRLVDGQWSQGNVPSNG